MNRSGLTTTLWIMVFAMPAWAFQALRPAEPVIIKGSQLAEFRGAPIEELKLFIWRDCQFEVVAFQWDERDDSGSYFSPDDGLLDDNDELAFQPQRRIGEQASPSDWLDDDLALVHPRLQIDILDDLTHASAPFYLFRTSSTATSSDSPIHYDAVNDVVTGGYYRAGFDPQLGIMNRLIFDDRQTVTGDILDREKLRIQGTAPIIGSFTLTEQELTNVQITAKSGPVRIIRRLQGSISFLAQTIPITLDRFFYTEYLGVPDDTAVTIPASSGVDHIRISFDLASLANGTVWSNNTNNAVVIDGTPDTGMSLPIPADQQDHYWSEARLDIFSWVNVGSFAGVAQDVNLYYHDDQNGGTGDGTPDTGDGQSFGDHGVRFSNIQAGQVKLAFQSFLLRNNQFPPSMLGMTTMKPLRAAIQSSSLADEFDLLISKWGLTIKNAPDVRYLVRLNDIFAQP